MSRSPISRSPGRGKKIDTFTYDLTSPVGTDKSSIDLAVYMTKSFSGDEPPYEVTAVCFSVFCDTPAFEINGSDLHLLLTTARARLDKAHEIAWERWLKVQITPERSYEGSGTGFRLSYLEVWRGVDSFGNVLMREYDRHAANTIWKISRWPETFKDKNGRTLACVPATKENEAALDDFCERINTLRKHLADFVSPDRIHDTLNAITSGSLPLLPKAGT